MTQERKGFTLVEMAIVLVVIGLIIAGIMAGQSLVRASRVQSVVTDFARYAEAIRTFHDKYKAMPGDMIDATNYWGSVTDSGAACPDGVGTGTQTCNGDGDGQTGTDSEHYEMFRAWQHLRNEGLIEGNFTGVAGSGGSAGTLVGINVPGSRMPGNGFNFRYWLTVDGLSGGFPQPSGHVIGFGKQCGDANAGAMNWCNSLVPAEAFQIDKKLDDGLPGTGNMRSTQQSLPASLNCTTSDDATTAEYMLTTTDVRCNVWLMLGI